MLAGALAGAALVIRAHIFYPLLIAALALRQLPWHEPTRAGLLAPTTAARRRSGYAFVMRVSPDTKAGRPNGPDGRYATPWRGPEAVRRPLVCSGRSGRVADHGQG